ATRSGNPGFIGAIDEVTVFDRALSADEVYALAQAQVAGAASADVGFEPFNLDGSSSTPTWYPATLTHSGAALTTWSYTLPANLEGFYNIDLRGADANGNSATLGTYWRGSIDTTAPRNTFTAQQLFTGALAETEYRLHTSDLFLDPASLN